MKISAQILIWFSLAVGVVSAATAYLSPLDTPDDWLLGRTLAAPAGRMETSDGSVTPIADKDEVVSVALLAELRAANVRNVRVKEFDIKRWRGKWYFLGSLCGLLAGGLVMRSATYPLSLDDGNEKVDPLQVLYSIQQEVQFLRGQVPKLAAKSALDLIVERVTALQRTQVPSFVEARETLIASLGLGGFASLMGSFAAAERQMNRAWSAAVDHVLEEAVDCLDQSADLLDETIRKMTDGA